MLREDRANGTELSARFVVVTGMRHVVVVYVRDVIDIDIGTAFPRTVVAASGFSRTGGVTGHRHT